jgi:MFS family permease
VNPDQASPNNLRRPVWLVGSATALSLFGDQALYTILPTCADKLGLIPFQVGVILSINRWVRLLTNHLAERLVRRFSPTRLLLIALTLGALLTLVYSTRPMFVILLVARMLWGLCWSFIRQVGIMTSIDCSSEQTKGRIVGLYNGIARTGSFVGMVVGGALYDLFRLTLGLGFKVGFSLTFAIFGVMSFLGLRLGAAARRGLRSHESVFRNPPAESKSDHIFGLLVCAFVIGCVGPGVILSTLGFILKWYVGEDLAVLGVPIGVATLTGLLISSRYAINALGAPTLGALLDRTGHHVGTVVCFCIATLILLAATFTSSVVVLACLIPAFFVCATSINVALIAEAGRSGSRAFARYASASDFGCAVGPILMWTIFEFIPSPTLSFAISYCFYAVGALFAYLRMRRVG